MSADHKQQEGALILGPAQDAIQEAHGAGCVRERGEAGVVQRGDQHAGGDADGFRDVVVLYLAAIGQQGVALREDCDEPRRNFKKGCLLDSRKQSGPKIRSLTL